jgi:hypothetical protein
VAHSSHVAQSLALHASERVNLLHWLSRIIVLHRIRDWSHGRLEIACSGEALIVLGPSGSSDVIRVTVHDNEVFTRILIGGSTGAGEAYMDGQWSCSDLPGHVAWLTICAINFAQTVGMGVSRTFTLTTI